MSETGKGLIAVAIVVCVWSGFIVISRMGASGVLLPTDLAALRYGVSGLFMLPVVLRIGLGGLTIGQIAVLTASAGFGFPLFAYSGFSLAPAAHGAVLLPGVLPLFTAVLAVAILGERMSWRRGLSLVAISTGIAFIAFDAVRASGGFNPGDLLFLGGSFSWAVFTIAARKWSVAPLTATAVVSVMTLGIYIPVYLVALPSNLAAAGWTEIAFQAAYQGLFAVIVAMLAFTRAVRALGSATTTMITAIVPGTASIAAVFILEEPFSVIAGLGIGAVTLGTLATVAGLRSRPAPGGVGDQAAR